MDDSSVTVRATATAARPGQRDEGVFGLGEPTVVLRPLVPGLAARVADRIQEEVGPYAGPPGGRTRRNIDLALQTAFEYFVDAVQGTPSSRRRVEEVFRELGRGEALEGRGLHAMRAAYDIGVRAAWAELHQFAVEHDLSARTLGQLGDAVFSFVDQLDDQVARGHARAELDVARATSRRRDRLVDAILAGQRQQAARLGRVVGWPVPPLIVPAVARTPQQLPDLNSLGARALSRTREGTTLLLCPAAAFDAMLPVLRQAMAGSLISVGWPVAVEEVGHALRWTRRALELVELGVIARAPVIHCTQHLTRLWLHAEPLLRQRASRTELRPLLAATPHQRLVLGETLCAWLETRDSAPVLARRLDVHPQTVRNRLRRLRELFGDRLDDPEDAFALTLALQATLPLWQAGHVDTDLVDGDADGGRGQ